MNTLLYEFANSSDSRMAFLLYGPWGSGKTYFIKNSFFDKVEAKQKYYVSLFGVTGIDDILRQLLSQRLTGNSSKKILALGSSAFSVIANVVTKTISEKYDVNIEDLDVPLSSIIPVEDCVIVFDDLERVVNDDVLHKLLGQISESFISEPTIRVIFIADESKISSGAFSVYKEKLVGFQSRIESFNIDVFSSIYTDIGDASFQGVIASQSSFICELIQELKVENLRTIRHYLDVLNALKLSELKIEVALRDILFTTFVLVIEEKSGFFDEIQDESEIPDFVKVKDRSYHVVGGENAKESAFSKYQFMNIRKKYSYSFCYYYLESIFFAIRFGELHRNQLIEEVADLDKYRKQRLGNPLTKLIPKLQGVYYLSNEEFVLTYAKFIDLIKTGQVVESLDSAIGAIKMLYYLSEMKSLHIDAGMIVQDYIFSHVGSISESGVGLLTTNLMDHFARDIYYISERNSDLGRELEEKSKELYQRDRLESVRLKIHGLKFSDLGHNDLFSFLISVQEPELIKILEKVRDESVVADFVNSIESALKHNSIARNSGQDGGLKIKLEELEKMLINQVASFELVESLWYEVLIEKVRKYKESL